jgi:hypothetical protein
MKNAIVIALVSLASVNAFAAPKSARITSMNLDPYAFNHVAYNHGSITVDGHSRDATLSLYRTIRCAPGALCAQMIAAPLTITLEIVSRKTNTCGAVVYSAVSDNRMVDGLRQVLTITDNATNDCKTMRAISPVEVTYETMGMTRKGNLHTVSTFMAEAFVSAQN